MKTNQRFIKMMLALVAMFMSMQVMAATKEVYAVYTSANGGTLTFYYDDLMSTRNGVYKEELNDVNDTPWWVDHAYKFKKVVFTSSFADARPKSTRCWFSDQPNFTIEGLGNLNTSEVEDMSWMFSGSGITGFDLSSFQTGSVKNMGGMFQECSKLISIDLSCLDTHSVTDMSQLFMDCGSLTSVNLSGLDARSVTEMSHMFSGCSSLTSLNFSSFTTRDLTNTDAMFENCTSLASLNLRNFNTSNVTSMSWMFFECTSLTSLDLSDFDTGNVTDMSVMFDSADKLTTIYVGEKWSTANVSESDYMFNDCTSLVGEKGTTYNSNKIGKEYAHVDGDQSNPGYLSALPYDLKIAGKTVTSMNQSDILENGIFSYSPKSNTLSVKGSYTYNVNERFMESSIDGLTINVTQDVTLEGRPDWPLISLNAGTTTFTGNGKLTLKKQNETGIYLTHSSSVIIKDMDMEIDALWGIAGPRDSHGQESLTIESSNITIKTSDKQPSDRTAICDLPGGIYLQGCSITSPSGAYISGGAVKTSNGSVAQDVTITVGNGIATNIDNGQRDSVKGQKDGWYTIDGRKLNGKPAKKGLYIHNGKTIVN